MADQGQRREQPTKVAGPSGDRWVNPNPVGGESTLVWGELVAAQEKLANTPEAVQARREQEELALQERRAQAKARAQAALETIKAFHAEVTAAAHAAAAMRPGPPASFHQRQAARWVLYGGQYGPQWGTGQQDAVLDQLYLLREKARSWYAGYLPGLDVAGDAGLKALDVAECAAHAALMARARIVSGEA
jgi:hypothetical protein